MIFVLVVLGIIGYVYVLDIEEIYFKVFIGINVFIIGIMKVEYCFGEVIIFFGDRIFFWFFMDFV